MSPVSTATRLLLVADSAETCESVASALLSAPEYFRVERVTSDQFAQRAWPPDVRLALVEQQLKSIEQTDVIAQLASLGLPPVALVDATDVQALQRVVLAGAAGLVLVPLDEGQLWETVSSVLARGGRAGGLALSSGPAGGRGEKRGTIVALYSPKAGSGTSVLSANLAIALHERSERGCALIEVGNDVGVQAILLNLSNEHTLGDLMARFESDDRELVNDVLARHASGLQVLLAPASQSLRIEPDQLEAILDLLQRMFDYVVVDVQRSSAACMLAAMRKSNAALLVVVPELPSLHQTRIFIEQMESTLPEVALNVVLNRSTLATGIPTDSIREHLKVTIGQAIPDDADLVTASVNRGVPLVLSHPRSAAARAIRALAAELAPRQSDGTGSAMSRLFGSRSRKPAREGGRR